MEKTKLSFLIAAHNEEKIISKTLRDLSKIPYKNYEIILGLDGCTDKTEEIVKSYEKNNKKIKHINLNLRQGKTAVINNIIKKAKGEIVIINDADWIFTVKTKEKLLKFLSVFKNEKIGGIAESFPVEFEKTKLGSSNLGYKMIALSSFYWFKFQKERLTYKKNNVNYIKEPTMFLTNIFRKKLFKENTSLGDDFERTRDIKSQGYDIVLFDDIEMPRMIAVYDDISIKKLFKQKIRTAMAREQIKKEKKFKLNKYYSDSIIYMLRESFKSNITEGSIVTFWIALTSIASIYVKFKSFGTKEGWKLRAR
ncbi:glycosyltransferase [Candidatus Pacearchaeota archaeon]|nr:glycosyltransferase [Candidatus Pacearchaeota archaeon]